MKDKSFNLLCQVERDGLIMPELINLPNEVLTIIKRLESAGYEAYAAGGCVRDYFLQRNSDDFDVTTSAKPEETRAVFKDYRVIETGIKHGTVTVIIRGLKVEVTTYRIDGLYEDNRRPSKVTYSKSSYEDTCRRDFTINALLYNPKTGVVDYHGGLEDIKNKVIKCVGEPENRFCEDALRILRALRFSSVLGFQIEDKTKKAIFKTKIHLKKISAERIATEFSKLLCGNSVRKILTEYITVLGVFIPELLPMNGFNQLNPYHKYDVFDHTARVVENCPPVAHLRLAALFHDSAKPLVQRVDKKGIGHYKGHAEAGMQLAVHVLNRLKYDKATIGKVKLLIQYHDDTILPEKPMIKRLMAILTPELLLDLYALQRADAASKGEKKSRRDRFIGASESLTKEIIAAGECYSFDCLAIKGGDLINAGLCEGPETSRLMKLLLDAVIDGKVENNNNALLDYAKALDQKNEN